MKRDRGFVKTVVEELKPYEVEHTEAAIKLDAMENPYPLPKALKELLVEKVKEVCINRYPDPNAKRLKEVYSRLVGIKPENLIIGNGSDELIQLILTAAVNPGGKVLFPLPTFSMYGIIAKPLNLHCIEVPLDEAAWELDEEQFIAVVKKEKPSVIFI
ncbi:MAG: aminotransferase class I/II-fold pyridoxal phosphate-dependent enzyme, partial [Nitrospinota bacterium]